MNELCLPAHAKINWGLAVCGRRPDGYHLLRSVMQKIDLADRVYIRPDGVDSCCMEAGPSVAPADNIALKAWLAMKKKYGLSGGLSIRIEKRIPAGAGLGGGSADAAAVLLGVNRLFALSLSWEELAGTALSLGADVPFCLSPHSAALAEGIGEALTPIPVAKSWRLLLVKPPQGVNTKAAFALYDTLPQPPRPDMDALASALANGETAAIAAHAGNMLEAAACRLTPEIHIVKQALQAAGLTAFMSGSGSAVAGWAADARQVEAAAVSLRQSGWQVWQTRTLTA
ncbi:MAG: 4-(cytidine 5'-diphospho)-2-C-methyl-D-erythritol kinase [Firmicutes bacterium]|nr:4-(cytidine 5'-diphospho)-2-C-methyl-D-erythritol kinase [Bacillota bacterium]